MCVCVGGTGSPSDVSVGRRGKLGDLGVERLIGPVLGDVIQVAVEVHQEGVVTRLQHLAGDGLRLLPLPQHDPGQEVTRVH